MNREKVLNFVDAVLENMPADWIDKTTHRLDIYNESLAKTEFLEEVEALFLKGDTSPKSLRELPTAFDYIRLGHPLSCLLEWTVAHLSDLKPSNVISFSSRAMPVLAILRKNLLIRKNTRIVYQDKLPEFFNVDVLREVYGYDFDVMKVDGAQSIPSADETTVFISESEKFINFNLNQNIDFLVSTHSGVGSVVLVNSEDCEGYVSEIQHVRRRESIAMTPASALLILKSMINKEVVEAKELNISSKDFVLKTISEITNADTRALLGSCGLSIQYAILMGLVHEALTKYSNKQIKIIVPPNCYGGTNDQARRVADTVDNVEVLDLPVDSGSDMAKSVESVLSEVSDLDAIPFIIAEIPTNPRVEVPDLIKLKNALEKERKNKKGELAVPPVFILDQTFCPNVHFLGEEDVFSTIQTISYVSGSKFPSGGLCTSGYCIANKKAEDLMGKVKTHLKVCDNEATPLQVEILKQQMPSMNQRIVDAYKNTRALIDFIQETLPGAKINFVSQGSAKKGFTPSVFSLDLPTKGENEEKREVYKRELNHKLIKLMIEKNPLESQHCVSYGQLKGCYWTIPATSTQGTTKEGDKDYIVRVAVSPDMDIEKHKKTFIEFVESI